ncbi:MAG: GGDEF domain-containing protein [Paucibacter sp.]|nr:GGDEF domain-containing protein [Roseateles sp.]
MGLLGLLLAASGAGASPRFDPELEHQLDQIVRLGQRDAQAAQSELEKLTDRPGARSRVYFSAARVAIEAGDLDQANGLIQQLEADATQSAQVAALRALSAFGQGQLSAAATEARKSMAQLDTDCPTAAVVVAAASNAGERQELLERCDVSSALIDLGILQADQFSAGAYPKAFEIAQHQLALARIADRDREAVQALTALAWVDMAREKPADALKWLQGMRRAAGDDLMLQAQAKTVESMLASLSGDKPAQLRALQDGVALARQSKVVPQIARAQINLADYYMHEHQPERALALLNDSLPVVQRLHDQLRERTLHHNMAVALIRLKQFAAARKEEARSDEFRHGQQDTRRIIELRELDDAWTEAGQPREAIALFHQERQLTQEANARNREALLAELQGKNNAAVRERDLALLQREQSIKDRQIANQTLGVQIGVTLAVLLTLASVLGLLMLRKARTANKALKAREALLRFQSERDPLTDLANRRHFLEVMQRHAADRFEGALLMVDIDHFKHVNDEHGHASGDAVICEVARRLSGAVRGGDLVVRWGGEEFLIFAPISNQEQVQVLAARIVDSVGRLPVATPTGPLRVTASAGFAHFPLGANLSVHWEQAVNWVDMALYTAKSRGRNCAIGIQGVHAEGREALIRIEKDFDAACSSGQVELCAVQGPFN